MTTTPVNWLTEIVVNDAPNETGSQTQPRITELRDGRILVSWQDNLDNYDSFVNADFIGQLFEMDGTPIGNPFVLNTVYNGGTTYPNNTTERNHEIAATPDGGFMIVYEDDNVSTSFIRAERFERRIQRLAQAEAERVDRRIVQRNDRDVAFAPRRNDIAHSFSCRAAWAVINAARNSG